MPLPEDQTLPSCAPIASSSSSAAVGASANSSGNALPPARDLSGLMDQFRQLGEDVADEEEDGEGSDAEGEGEEEGEEAAAGAGAADGQGREGS